MFWDIVPFNDLQHTTWHYIPIKARTEGHIFLNKNYHSSNDMVIQKGMSFEVKW
jgi:hypothetical protein